MRVIHLISGLGLGGAEKNLSEIVLSDNKHENIIISLTKQKYFYPKIKNKAKIEFLDFKNKNVFINLFKLVNLIIKYKPNVINSWMYHANLITILFVFFKIKIIWNFRHSNLIGEEAKKFKIYEKLLIYFSYFVPNKIVFNSNKSKDHYLKLGMPSKKTVIIHNGLRLKFLPIKIIRNKKKLITLGMAARWNLNKDFELLFECLHILKKKNHKFILNLCGNNMDRKNKELIQLINKFNLNQHIKLFGKLENMEKFYKDLDINLLVSKSESFPNVIIEAAMCGIYNIASDVGDIKHSFSKYLGIFYNKHIFLSLLEKTIFEIKSNEKKLFMKKIQFQNLIKKKYSIKNQIISYSNIYSA